MNSELAKLETDQLIKLALTKDESRDYIIVLEHRGSKDVLVAAQQLCQSQKITERDLGVNILGQLGIPERTFPDECLNTLLTLLETETDNQILSSIGIALGHLKDSRAIEPLIKFKSHPDPDVRLGVVCGISAQESCFAIDTLIDLSTDSDADVRNWATFGLGVLIDTDTPMIRDALWQRLVQENTKDYYEIYGEALVGLARRKDSRIIPLLIEEFESDIVGYLAIEAAEEIGDSRLYSALIKLRSWWSSDQDLLARAIKNCQKSQ